MKTTDSFTVFIFVLDILCGTYCTVLYFSVRITMTANSTMLVLLCFTILYFTVLQCTVLYCTALHCAYVITVESSFFQFFAAHTYILFSAEMAVLEKLEKNLVHLFED